MYARGGERRRGVRASGRDDCTPDPDGAEEGREIREGEKERQGHL